MQYLVIDTSLEMALTDEYLARMGIWQENWIETQVDDGDVLKHGDVDANHIHHQDHLQRHHWSKQ